MKCQNCGQHEATVKWAGDFGAFAISHQWALQDWCNGCALRAQIEHIEESLPRLAVLKEELEEWETASAPS